MRPAIRVYVIFLLGLLAAHDTATGGAVDLVTAFKILQIGFQRMMPCGYEPLNLPPLAPFSLKLYSLNMTTDYLRLISNISNVMVNGLENFQVVDFSSDNATNRITYDLFLPEVQVIGSATLDLWANMAGLPFSLASGDMLLDVRVIGFRVSGSFLLGPNPYTPRAPGVFMRQLRFTYNVADVVTSNWNNLWNIDFNNFVNEWLRSYALMGAQQMRPIVEQQYAPLVQPQINGLLENVTMNDLIALFVRLGMEFLDAGHC